MGAVEHQRFAGGFPADHAVEHRAQRLAGGGNVDGRRFPRHRRFETHGYARCRSQRTDLESGELLDDERFTEEIEPDGAIERGRHLGDGFGAASRGEDDECDRATDRSPHGPRPLPRAFQTVSVKRR